MTKDDIKTNTLPSNDTAQEETAPDFQMEAEIICSPEFSCIEPDEGE